MTLRICLIILVIGMSSLANAAGNYNTAKDIVTRLESLTPRATATAPMEDLRVNTPVLFNNAYAIACAYKNGLGLMDTEYGMQPTIAHIVDGLTAKKVESCWS